MNRRNIGTGILLTGFEAFGENAKNPTSEIVRLLDGASVAGRRVSGVELPVTARKAPGALKAAVECQAPGIVLSLGLAGGREMLGLERVAINVLDFPIPDNAGEQPIDEPVATDGPAAYFATLPIKAILSAWREAGLPGYVSNTAGTYACNQVFYGALHLSRERGFRAGFVHVPYLPEQAVRVRGGAPSVSLDVMVRAVETALEVSIARPEDAPLSAGALS